jgi:hypothetical protein
MEGLANHKKQNSANYKSEEEIAGGFSEPEERKLSQ